MLHYHDGVAVRQKGDKGPVTAADHASHAVIVEELAASDSSIPIISEEGDIPGYETRRAWRRFWLVDPLDGTKEFIQRNGEFTVNIALIENGIRPRCDLCAGVEPALLRRSGTWRVEARLVVSRAYSFLATATGPCPSGGGESSHLQRNWSSISRRSRSRTGHGRELLKFCWVAEGKADIYPPGPDDGVGRSGRDCIFRNSGTHGPGVAVYNQPELRNQGFIVGLDSELTPPAVVAACLVYRPLRFGQEHHRAAGGGRAGTPG
jgi:3'(2'), 5'-bisphosphate nucleotidase